MAQSRKRSKTKQDVVERRVTICNRLGLHARAAGKLRNLAGHYKSHIEIINGDVVANAKSVLGLMALEGYKGVELLIKAAGADAQDAAHALAELVERRFDEDE